MIHTHKRTYRITRDPAPMVPKARRWALTVASHGYLPQVIGRYPSRKGALVAAYLLAGHGAEVLS